MRVYAYISNKLSTRCNDVDSTYVCIYVCIFDVCMHIYQTNSQPDALTLIPHMYVCIYVCIYVYVCMYVDNWDVLFFAFSNAYHKFSLHYFICDLFIIFLCTTREPKFACFLTCMCAPVFYWIHWTCMMIIHVIATTVTLYFSRSVITVYNVSILK